MDIKATIVHHRPTINHVMEIAMKECGDEIEPTKEEVLAKRLDLLLRMGEFLSKFTAKAEHAQSCEGCHEQIADTQTYCAIIAHALVEISVGFGEMAGAGGVPKEMYTKTMAEMIARHPAVTKANTTATKVEIRFGDDCSGDGFDLPPGTVLAPGGRA